MKKFLILTVLLSVWAATSSAAFVEGLEDVPLPNDLTQIENANLSFGNEEIRLIENYLTSSSLKFGQVCGFYKETLPQIGWKKTKQTKDKIAFERDGEILEISKESETPLIVRLTVKSKI